MASFSAPFPKFSLVQELIEHILDFLADDLHSLCNCSLVSRDWVSRARHHIFRCLVVEHFATHHGIIQNIHSLIPIIQSPLNTILPVIDELILTVERDITISIPLFEATGAHPYSNLTKLSIRLDVRPWDTSNVLWIAPLVPRLTELTVNVPGKCDEDMIRFIMAFPLLQELGIYGSDKTQMIFPSESSLPSGARTNLSGLRALHLHTPDNEVFLSWIGLLQKLRVLDVTLWRGWNSNFAPYPRLNAFLSAHGNTLQHLCLGFACLPETDIQHRGDNHPELSALTKLEHLEIHDHDMNIISNILGSLNPSARLRDVILSMVDIPTFYIPDSVKFWLPSCDALKYVLAHPSFTGAQRELCIPNRYDNHSLVSIQQAFEGSSVKVYCGDNELRQQPAADWMGYVDSKRSLLSECKPDRSTRGCRECLSRGVR